MRIISIFLLVFILAGCNSKTSVMTEEQFAKVYMDSLVRKYPDVKFDLNPDLTITAKKGELDFKHYTDNAYLIYKATPDSAQQILHQYLTSTEDVYAKKMGIDVDKIVPIIKPIDYLEEVKNRTGSVNDLDILIEKYNDQLIIAFAEDSKNSIKYLTESDFKNLAIPRDSLRLVALKNLDKILPEIQRQGGDGLFMVTAGGVYEVSLILMNSIWTNNKFPVDGDLIIAIPNRDMLMITGSKNLTGITKLRQISSEAYSTGTYPVSKYLFRWTGKKFERFD